MPGLFSKSGFNRILKYDIYRFKNSFDDKKPITLSDRAIDRILQLVPDFKEFREPFVGGGTVFIHLKQIFPERKFWINDLYFELYKFWEMSQKDIDGVINQIWQWRNSFSEGKELFQYLTKNINTFDDLQKASAFFIFNRITFSGTTEAGGFSQQAFEKRFTESSIVRLKKLEQVLSEIYITHFDYQNVVEAEGENVFIFLDPPYFSATKSALYGKKGKLHTSFDHVRFTEVMKKCEHKWLITYDDSPYIRELFSFAHIQAWDLMYGMRNQTENSSQTGKELFISNFVIPVKAQSKKQVQTQLFAE